MKKSVALRNQSFLLVLEYIKWQVTLQRILITCTKKNNKQLKFFALGNPKFLQLKTSVLERFQRKYRKTINLTHKKHQLIENLEIKKQ